MSILARWRRRRPYLYVYRTDKPEAVFALPLIGRHFAYAGETWNEKARHLEHLEGSRVEDGGRYDCEPKSWSDLNPVRYLIPLPWWCAFKPVLRTLETLLMLVTWPVYNDRKNRWNPRRISIAQARRQRELRDLGVPRALTAAPSPALVVGVALVLFAAVGFVAAR